MRRNDENKNIMGSSMEPCGTPEKREGAEMYSNQKTFCRLSLKRRTIKGGFLKKVCKVRC